MLTLFVAVALQTTPSSNMPMNWFFKARDKDPITDLQSARVQTNSIAGDAKLSVQCDVIGEPIVSVLYIPSKFTGSSGSQRIIFRADANAPIELLGETVSRAKAITDIKAVRSLTHMFAQAQTLFVRAFDYNGQPVDARFNVAGGEGSIRAVFAACKIPYEVEVRKKRK